MEPRKYKNDKELFLALRKRDNQAFSYLYKTRYSLIRTMILNKGGSNDDVKDIYQDSLIAFDKNLMKDSFQLTSSLNTYIYSIAKNLWLKEVNKRSKSKEVDIDDSIENQPEKVDDENQSMTELKLSIAQETMSELGDPCKTLLTNYYFYKKSMEEIASEMGYNSPKTAKNAKYKCMERLRKAVAKKMKKLRLEEVR